MRRHSLKDLSTADIDEVTSVRLRQYEQLTDTKVTFPVPIEKVVERVLGLDFDWDEIEEQPGETILGGLVPEDRCILLNTKHLDLFEEKPGLERSTIGHEAGHWDIDIDRTSLHHPSLPGLNIAEEVVFRRSRNGNDEALVKVLNRAVVDDRYLQVYRKLTAGRDSYEVANAVDRYQSSFLMPRWLVFEAVENLDLTVWPNLYELSDLMQVTISNLVVRLHRLDLIFIPEDSKTIYPGIDAYTGQKHLFD